MKLTQHEPNRPDPVKTKFDIRQVLKTKHKIGTVRLQPGQKLYEMVCTSNSGQSVVGLNPVTGDFDPDLAVVRPVHIENTAITLGSAIVGEFGTVVNASPHHKVTFQDGNIYMEAINESNARKKIIKRFFPNHNL